MSSHPTPTPNALDALRAIGDGGLADALDLAFSEMEWAEDEIAKAQKRHGESGQDGPIWSAFKLLHGTDALMHTEFVYRAHAREILERVVAGEDTREMTDAELACVMSQVSLEAPLPPEAVTLYIRSFRRAFPTQALTAFGSEESDDEARAREQLYAEKADQLEREVREKGRQDWRTAAKATKAAA